MVRDKTKRALAKLQRKAEALRAEVDQTMQRARLIPSKLARLLRLITPRHCGQRHAHRMQAQRTSTPRVASATLSARTAMHASGRPSPSLQRKAEPPKSRGGQQANCARLIQI